MAPQMEQLVDTKLMGLENAVKNAERKLQLEQSKPATNPIMMRNKTAHVETASKTLKEAQAQLDAYRATL
jgi:hypothetical protein